MANIMGGETSPSENKTRAVPMPVELLQAAIEGDGAELVRLLGLKPQEGHHSEVPIDPQDPDPSHMKATEQIAEHLQSVTHSGDTVLHILVTNKHNELASMVFQKDRSLLEASNEKQETPLHSAAKVGNENIMVTLIDLAPSEVKDVLRLNNHQGNTALHEAAKHGHEAVVRVLMQCDPKVTRKVNHGGLSPLYMATVGGYTSLVKIMLQNEAHLAYLPDSTGLLPVHVAARMGHIELVKLFMQEYPNSAKLLDHRRRNIFHITADENKKEILTQVFTLKQDNTNVRKLVADMIIVTDYEGNTPLHIAAMKGHHSIIRAIWREISTDEEAIPNNQGLTPFDLSMIQLKDSTHDEDMQSKIMKYIDDNGRSFTSDWFDDIMTPSDRNQKENKMQVVAVGSVLITTVAFAVAFTLPGGLNQDNGTPILGRKYIFRAFILANSLAFIQAFQSVYFLITTTLSPICDRDIEYAYLTFLSAASCMVLAFGLGSYVMLAPVTMPIAILILVITLLLGSPGSYFLFGVQNGLVELICDTLGHTTLFMIQYGVALLFIFCLAFM